MPDLSIRAVQWCAQHGHPVLALETDDHRYFVVAMSAEDGAALAVFPDPTQSETPSRRLYLLVEAVIRTLDARLSEVRLHVGSDNLLRASLVLRGPGGERVLPANFADGVVLAHRDGLPLRMADEDLARVPLAPLIPTEPAPEPPAPPEAFRSLIESLDFEGLGAIRGDRGAHAPEQHAPRRTRPTP